MEELYITDPLQDPLIRRVVKTMGLPRGSRGLDAGCGVGLQIPPLVEAVGPKGRVTGLDILPEFIQEAGKNLRKWALEEQVSLIQGDIYDLPFSDREFDWIWSSSCACYAMRRPLELLEGFRRVLAPGGLLRILNWSGQQLLPGYPRLEALLNATAPGLAPFRKDGTPEHHFLRLPCWLRKAGFLKVTARPFTQGACAPLDEPMRKALLSLIEMRWRGAEKELSGSDRRLYLRITDPACPDFVLDLPDYYGFYTCTLFAAEAPE
jgi:demethylmenaquinone methyltransferase/2-methoxy-6-polyprenyl-1,4-benzoquinol methylase